MADGDALELELVVVEDLVEVDNEELLLLEVVDEEDLVEVANVVSVDDAWLVVEDLVGEVEVELVDLIVVEALEPLTVETRRAPYMALL